MAYIELLSPDRRNGEKFSTTGLSSYKARLYSQLHPKQDSPPAFCVFPRERGEGFSTGPAHWPLKLALCGSINKAIQNPQMLTQIMW